MILKYYVSIGFWYSHEFSNNLYFSKIKKLSEQIRSVFQLLTLFHDQQHSVFQNASMK